MITRIQKSKGSAIGALNYNFNKEEGTCTILTANELVPEKNYTLRYFQKIENNVWNPRSQNLYTHLTVNPGLGEEMTDEKAETFINELMDKMGYGKQPYIVFKHQDIVRNHYHIVASRIKPDGHLIPDSKERYRLRDITKELEKSTNTFTGKI